MGQESMFLLVRDVLRALEHGKLPSPALFRQLLSKVRVQEITCPPPSVARVHLPCVPTLFARLELAVGAAKVVQAAMSSRAS